MNFGTKLRTILRIAVSLNTALCITQNAICDVNIEPLTVCWAILTVISDFVVAFITTYYNNDYTEEACEGTGITRHKKRAKKKNFVGEDFNAKCEEEEDEQ